MINRESYHKSFDISIVFPIFVLKISKLIVLVTINFEEKTAMSARCIELEKTNIRFQYFFQLSSQNQKGVIQNCVDIFVPLFDPHMDIFHPECGLWQYRLWSFQGRDKNQKGFWLKTNCSLMKSLNFGNWCNREVSKSANSIFSQIVF